MAIYIKIEKQDTPQEFLKLLYPGHNPGDYNSLGLPHDTFSDKECLVRQCTKGRMRSFDDLFELMQTYYPELSIIDVLNLLISHVPTGTLNFPKFGVCSTMKRIRFIYGSYIENATLRYYRESFNHPIYESKHSWRELFAMLGIKDGDELMNYVNKMRNL